MVGVHVMGVYLMGVLWLLVTRNRSRSPPGTEPKSKIYKTERHTCDRACLLELCLARVILCSFGNRESPSVYSILAVLTALAVLAVLTVLGLS